MLVKQVKIADIIISEDRQRKDLGDLEALAQSIEDNGLINPITINGMTLIAGERRLRACQLLEWSEIPAHQQTDLDRMQTERIELEENTRRKDLSWQEHADAVARYHKILQATNPEWTQVETAEALNISSTQVGKAIAVDLALKEGDTRIASATSVNQGYNIVRRREKRSADNELAQLFEEDAPETAEHLEIPILREDFATWAPNYSGPPFSFIHCDFPYGIEHTDSDQGSGDQWQSYGDDSPELYFSLIHSLVTNLDRLLYSSGHVMFWYSMKHHQETAELFEGAGLKVASPFPLIWHKTDNKGILADAKRRPRHIYETALMLSRGDRHVVEAIADCYGAPSQKQYHQSEKPVPVLSHFFRMFIDGGSEILDPTCGSGSSLVAADAMGASRILGLDIEQDNVDVSIERISNARKLRQA